ncbi:MAG: 5-oxoprolinase subunit PxpB [Bacteroidetes bacterium]|nr:5-oxoprolinase subunit PxpB [Bacteroidota bacterium]
MKDQYTISFLNEEVVLISFANKIDFEINDRVIELHRLLAQTPFPGFIESVPAYASLAVYFNRSELSKASPLPALSFVEGFLKNLMNRLPANTFSERRKIKIPVLYDGEDLPALADQQQLKIEEIITIHTAVQYRVFMLGFLPGFPYMGMVDARIAAPRKATPRTCVPAGSVGIAGFQTGIYPQSSPGGWQLIGRTPLKIFDTLKNPPALLKAGDEIFFFAVSQNEFNALNEY